mmetsp:Transcript_7516/g.17299  ORF Transcript_7516/g.17299 Transcript_7516/m.17299 type:complete len:271 (-) Transcript_7516:1065-1877(-)
MYSNMKLIALSTPFWMLISGTRYSFMRAGRMVNGPHVSATMAMATVVQTLIWRSWTLRLLSRVCSTSCGPIALAMYPNVLTDARRMAFLCALSNSSSSKQMRIHSLAETNSAPRSAMRPTRSMQFSCTFSCLFLKMGVNLGSRSRIGGGIFDIPMTLTIALSAPSMLPRTSGYSSPRYSYRTTPRWPMSCSSPQAFMTTAIRPMRSAACILTLAARLLSRHLIVPAICFRYGRHRSPSAFTTVPNPSSMIWPSRPNAPLDPASTACSWNA